MNTFFSKNLAKIFKSKSFNFQFQRNLKDETLFEKAKNSWKRATNALTEIEETTKGNKVTMYFTGDEMFKEMWSKIENAKESISLETYTLEPDIIGNKTMELLTEAKQRGVKVRFAYDAIGSSTLSDFDLYQMKISGVELYQFNPISILPKLPYTLRNHRKIMVVDDKYGFCGGMNISGKYASSKFDGGKDYFRDTHCMIEGPAVEKLNMVFFNSIKDKKIMDHSKRSSYRSSALTASQLCWDDPSFIKSLKKQQLPQDIEIFNNSDNNNNNNNNNSNNIDSNNNIYSYIDNVDIYSSFIDKNKNNNYKDNFVVDEDESTFDSSQYSLVNQSIERLKQDEFDLTDNEYEDVDDDDFKEFVTFTNDFQTLQNLNNLNNYILDESNIPKSKLSNNGDEILIKEKEEHPKTTPISINPNIEPIETNKVLPSTIYFNHGANAKDTKINDKPSKIIMKSVRVENTVVQVQESNRFRRKRAIQKSLIVSLNGARDHCYITTPYFLPARRLRKAIINAALRGVEIRIITAGKSDVPWFRNASRHIYHKFLKHDHVRIYEMVTSTLHAKTLSIDGVYCTIGSFNLDTWSRKNLEANLAFLSPQLVNVLEQQFKNDLKGCKEITIKELDNRSLLDRIICYLCYQLSKILKP